MNLVIIGGVAAGMSAATRARRLDESARITVLEKGGYISFANCGLPYYLAGRIEDEADLLITTPSAVRERFRIDARVHHEVTRIDRQARVVHGIDHARNTAFELPFDKLIVAIGASPILPSVDHLRARNVFLLRSMEDTQAVRAWLDEQKPASAVIAGGGFIGLEMAEALREQRIDVTVLDKSPHVLPPLDAEMAADIDAELKRHGVRVITGDGLKQLHGSDDLVTAVETEAGRRLTGELVLLSIGVRPNTRLASDAGLALGSTGAIAVDAHQRTNDPDIYAVGDVSEVTHGSTRQPARIPLAGPANRQGRLAGEHAVLGRSAAAAPVFGTAIVQVFDLAAGVTGLSERAARAAGLDIDTAYVQPKHHAGYYPGAEMMRMKLVYEKATGRLLGAQAIGAKGVDKRIDVLATTLHFGGTIDDLAQLDLAYAPQFGSAKDAIHLAAMVAQNQRHGVMPAVDAPASGQTLLDVRTREEYARGSLGDAVNIPVDQLRDRLGELDRGKPIVTFCQVGQRGYVAQRILQQHGFKQVSNLKGGYSLAKAKAL